MLDARGWQTRSLFDRSPNKCQQMQDGCMLAAEQTFLFLDGVWKHHFRCLISNICGRFRPERTALELRIAKPCQFYSCSVQIKHWIQLDFLIGRHLYWTLIQTNYEILHSSERSNSKNKKQLVAILEKGLFRKNCMLRLVHIQHCIWYSSVQRC